jgi:hypothetical protein
MTLDQRDMIDRLAKELAKRGNHSPIDWTESDAPESLGFVFGEVDGVTVTITPWGLVNIPAVRSYHSPKYSTPVIAAACAKRTVGGAKGT